MNRTRILVVEDSLTARNHLTQVLSAVPDFEVVGTATDGESAIELCARLKPDIITLDVILPTMNGLEVTEHIMAYHPTPILIVSAIARRNELFSSYDALAAGAIDILDKSDGIDPTWDQKLVAAVRMVAKIRPIRHPRARLGRFAGTDSGSLSAPKVSDAPPQPQAVLIGASTGGPSALLSILKGLPADFPLPIVIALHMSEAHCTAFPDWLSGLIRFPVSYAEHGERLPDVGECRVLLARAGYHLQLGNGRLWLSDEPERHSCRPSVDVLFESAAPALGGSAIACLLTGMGRDGAQGLLAVRNAGGMTIAQDESTSVVFGMPGAAIRLGAAQHIVGLDQIPAMLNRLVRRRREMEASP